MTTEIRLALTGFGNVGKGVASLLGRFGDEYERRYDIRLLLTGVADRGGAVTRRSGIQPFELLQAKQESGTVAAVAGGSRGLHGDAFLEQAGADILVEAASTNFVDAEPGLGYVRGSLDRGTDVVLASKGALVLHYRTIMDRARQSGQAVLFGGTIGAPLPVLEIADRMLTSVPIVGFEGVVNSTANFVLMLMAEGISYDAAVAEAQRIGIAETDPTLDVDGWDAAAKAVIIANSVFGADLRLTDIPRTGIRGLDLADVRQAAENGLVTKLISKISTSNGVVSASVEPEQRERVDPLGALGKNEMGFVFRTDVLGDVCVTVQDVGGIPTAATVLRDVLNLVRDGPAASPLR